MHLFKTAYIVYMCIHAFYCIVFKVTLFNYSFFIAIVCGSFQRDLLSIQHLLNNSEASLHQLTALLDCRGLNKVRSTHNVPPASV